MQTFLNKSCPQCGKLVVYFSEFCPNCGTSIESLQGQINVEVEEASGEADFGVRIHPDPTDQTRVRGICGRR